MLDNIFKNAEKTDDVVVTPVAPTPVVPATEPVTPTPIPAPAPAQPAVKTAPVTCTNCEDSGLTCSVCGYNKP